MEWQKDAPRGGHSTDDFEQQVYTLVAAIPKGKVASYGQLAVLAGGPQWARRAGRAIPGLPRSGGHVQTELCP